MFTRRKTFVTSLIALCLAIISLVHFTLSNYSTPTAAVRTMELSQIAIDEQAILNEFDDAVIENEGSLTSFTGYKAIDATIFEEFDNISADDVDDFVGCRVKYDFSYDSETNIVTIAAEMKNELGEIYIDEIQGVCFINDNGEVDAVLNVEGEGILLSEMRDAGMIQNCGWFTKLIKKVAVATTVVAVTVAAVAVVVATAGAAAPAVVGVGVAAATATTTSALAIASTSLTVAVIAAGVAVTATVVEFTFEGVKYRLEELTDSVRYELRNNGLYRLALTNSDGMMLVSTIVVDANTASRAMKSGISCYTYSYINAYNVAKMASDGGIPVHDEAHKAGYFAHYHRANRKGSAHAFYGFPDFSV